CAGQSLARFARASACALVVNSLIAPSYAQIPAPASQTPEPPAPQPMSGAAPPGPQMTLDQAAPVVMPAPAPPGQGVIQRIVVEGTQRIEPDSVLSYLLLRAGQPYDPAVADRSLKVLFDTG